MKIITNARILTVLILGLSFAVSGCFRKGEEDPFFSIHTRDARMAQNWQLTKLTGTVVNTTNGLTTNINYNFDGTNIFITTNGNTVSYGYAFEMNISDNGTVISKETFTDPANPNVVYNTSSKTSYWFWANDVKNKTTVNLDLTGTFQPYPAYDIPRLAWNDMALLVDYTDNYQQIDPVTGTTISSSSTVNLNLEFDVILPEN